MKTDLLWFVVVAQTLAVGCGSTPPPDEGGGSHRGLRASIKDSVITVTGTQTQTSTYTQSSTYTESSTSTHTQTATGNVTTKTATANYLNVTGTGVGTVTLRNDYVGAKPYVWTATLTRADTAVTTFIGSGTATGTYADSGATYTGSGTTTLTMQFSSFATATTTKTVAAYYAGALSKTMLATGTGVGWSGRITWTYTKTATGAHTDTITQTQTQTLTQTTTPTATTTVTVTTTATSTSTSDGGGGGGACLQDWRNTMCGQWCTRETQWDRTHCTVFLDCYLENGTGPTDDPNGTCGVNRFPYGVAPKTIADQVYQCLACPGSTPSASCTGLPDTTPCTYANPCTQNNRCQGGVCVPGPAVACPAPDGCHGPGTCNPSTGACGNYTVLSDDTPCDDASACTDDDRCQDGICVGQNPITCTASDQCHAAGICNAQTGLCPNDPVPDGTDCYYSTGCPEGQLCQKGSCVGGSCATCAGVNLVALKTYSPVASTDGEQEFSAPALFTVPKLMNVIDGLSGSGTTILSIQQAGACPTCFTACTYRGGSSQEHPSTPLERAYAGFYVFESCEGGLVAGQKLLATKLRLHTEQGDSQAGPTRVQLSVGCAEDQSAVVTPIAQESVVTMSPAQPSSSQPPPQPPPGGSSASQMPRTNPEVNGVFTPIADPSIVFVAR